MSEANPVKITQSVAILIDGNNIERSLHALTGNPSSMINFDVIIPKLLNGRGLSRLIYFREGKAISSKLAERLLENFMGSVVPCHKSADIPLTISATQIARKVDTIIVLSGDADYVELVRHLRGEGVRVEIAAVVATTASILIDAADHFVEITVEDSFSLPSKGRRNSSRKNTSSKTSKKVKIEAKKKAAKNTSTNSSVQKPKKTVSKKSPASKAAPKNTAIKNKSRSSKQSSNRRKSSSNK